MKGGRYGRRTGIARRSEPTRAQLFDVPVQGRSTDERYTPPELFEALGMDFDLDVAAPEGGVPWVPARRWFTKADDGLSQPWEGRVWMNPPFSKCEPWVDRFVAHGEGVALLPMSQAAWGKKMQQRSDWMLIPYPPVYFVSPAHAGQHISFGVAVYGLGVPLPETSPFGRVWS